MAAAARIAALRPAPTESERQGAPRRRSRVRSLGREDTLVLLGLGLLFLLFAGLTWKTWGSPQTDYGVELTTADRLTHGASLYGDVRYFYGPLGVYPLALAFEIFGTSFTTAFGFGLLVALAIFASFHALARTWLSPAFAGAATAIVMAIGFTGTLFGYVAPHTLSATFGMLAILLELLALARGRSLLAGIATGAAALTRPELALVAFAALAGFAIGCLLQDGWRRALRELVRMLPPALLIPLLVMAPFAISVGPGDLLFDQIVPLDMLRISGLKFQANWAPYNAISAIAIGARGLVYLVLLAALAATSVLWHKRGFSPRVLLPLAGGIGFLLVLDGVAHVLGLFPGTIGVVQTEAKRLLLGMSWLPVAVGIVVVWAAVRARQAKPAPISGSWAVDLALIGAGLVLAGRAYNSFTTDTYAAYYAPVLVLFAVVLHQRIAELWPGARTGVLLALAAIFVAMSWNAVATGPASEDDFEVHTSRGTYMAPGNTGPNYQRTLDLVRAHTAPGDAILALPLEGGLPFAADRRPALRELQFHPGVVDSRSDEREAIDRLQNLDVKLIVQGNARFDDWGLPVIGVDYDQLLLDYIHRHYPRVTEVGDYAAAPVGRIFARAFRIYESEPQSSP